MKIFARFYYIWDTCGWGGWNTAKGNKVSNLPLAALIISERIAAPEENNAEKIAKIGRKWEWGGA